MKKFLLTSGICHTFLFVTLSGVEGFSQTYCGTSRFDSEIFPSVTTTSNVIYGFNTKFNGGGDTLKMDIYQPTGDTASVRPVIIFAHGGSFVGGTKTDADEVTFATRFAKRGYVTASIEYRLGMNFINQAEAQKAVYRATQDMKAAVRFFRKDAYTTNTYKIDTNYVFVGGYSAGAFMAVNYAYMDMPSEIPAAIDTNTLGNLEGNSGNPGYSSRINAVLNFAGAVGDTSWMHAGDEPMITAQGDNDKTVPYCTAMIYISGFPIMVVSGGGSMNIRCNNIGLENPIHTFYGQDHPADVSTTNIDTVISLASDFTFKQLGCVPSNTTPFINQPTCQVGAGVNEIILSSENVSLYPNPANEKILVHLKNVKGNKFRAEISDITGRKFREIYFSDLQLQIDRKNLANGIYFLKLTSNENESFTTKIIFTE